MFQMGNKKPKSYLYYLKMGNTLKITNRVFKGMLIDVWDKFSPMEIVRAKMILNTHYWCECKMGSTFIQDNLSIPKFEIHISLSQF